MPSPSPDPFQKGKIHAQATKGGIKISSQSPQMALMFGLPQILVAQLGQEYLTLFLGFGSEAEPLPAAVALAKPSMEINGILNASGIRSRA